MSRLSKKQIQARHMATIRWRRRKETIERNQNQTRSTLRKNKVLLINRLNTRFKPRDKYFIKICVILKP
jgi:hypothetical protein